MMCAWRICSIRCHHRHLAMAESREQRTKEQQKTDEAKEKKLCFLGAERIIAPNNRHSNVK